MSQLTEKDSHVCSRIGAGFGVAHQGVNEFGRTVVLVARAGQFDGGREAFAEIGILLLNDGRESVVVEPTAERQQQPEDEHDQAKAGPGAENTDANR